MYCEVQHAQTVVDISKRFNVDAKIIGYIEPSTSQQNEVLIQNNGVESLFLKHSTK